MLYILSEMFCIKREDTGAGKMEDLSKKEKQSGISSAIALHVLLDSLGKACQIPGN